MSFPAKYAPAYSSTAKAAFTANDASSGVVTTSAAMNTADVESGSLSVNLYLQVYTINLALRGKWQGSTDNSTWVDYAPENGAAQVTLQSDTGTRTVSVVAPSSVTSKKYARYGLYVVGGSTGTASDVNTISYSYRKYNPFATRG